MNNYKFPVIESFKDIEFALDPNYFIVADRGDHTIVNYLYSCPEAFPEGDSDISLMRREFRGLIFDSAGNLIRRPFHKFFNVGERSDTQISNIDISKPHLIYEKLDGSMICPYIIGKDIIWGSKMGDTDVAKQVEEFLKDKPQYTEFVLDCKDNGNLNPIFEWCSRKQRIVVDYPEDQLVLTAVRDIRTGEYRDYENLWMFGNIYSIPVCSTISGKTFTQNFMDETRKQTEGEGYVIEFSCGNRVKIKNEHYCNLHRIKSDLSHEIGIIKLLLDDKIDDAKPLLDKNDLSMVINYENNFWNVVGEFQNIVKYNLKVINDSNIDRKTFALCDTVSREVKHICFKLFGKEYTSKDVQNLVIDLIRQNINKKSKFEDFKSNSYFSKLINWNDRYFDNE